jgi:hypothetical protein
MNDQENIKRIQARESEMERLQEWEEIYREMAEGSGEPPINPKKVEQSDPMAQVLHSLREELKSHTDSLVDYKKSCVESEGEWISQGWCEALAFAINKVEESMYEEVQVTKHMSIKQKRDDAKLAVTSLRDYLITGKRGTDETTE